VIILTEAEDKRNEDCKLATKAARVRQKYLFGGVSLLN